MAEIPRENGFLLIKCWGCGFWSDMQHVVGQLLIAEIIDRYPIVYWGKASRYGGAENTNAFEHFFLPVSTYTIADLARADFTYFPAIWGNKPLDEDDPNRYLKVPYLPEDVLVTRRSENVIVSDRHMYPAEIMPYIPSDHPAYGLSEHEMYRYIFTKYIKLRTDVEKEIEDFFAEQMQNKPILAVHVRGGDKIYETEKLWEINQLYLKEIDNYFIAHPEASIFLLTDSLDILAEYQAIYGNKLIYTDCVRTYRGNAGVHVLDSDGRSKGIEIIKDIFLAIRCDTFIGNAHSNVSIAIQRLKPWQGSKLRMLGTSDLLGQCSG